MNVIVVKQKIFSPSYTYPFQSSGIARICFEVGILAQICLKLRHFQ